MAQLDPNDIEQAKKAYKKNKGADIFTDEDIITDLKAGKSNIKKYDDSEKIGQCTVEELADEDEEEEEAVEEQE